MARLDPGSRASSRLATCSGLRPDHGGWEVRVGAFAMYRGLGENAHMGEADTTRGVWLAALAIFGKFDRGDAGSAPGGLRYLVGPLQRGESDVTRGNRHQISWRPARRS